MLHELLIGRMVDTKTMCEMLKWQMSSSHLRLDINFTFNAIERALVGMMRDAYRKHYEHAERPNNAMIDYISYSKAYRVVWLRQHQYIIHGSQCDRHLKRCSFIHSRFVDSHTHAISMADSDIINIPSLNQSF